MLLFTLIAPLSKKIVVHLLGVISNRGEPPEAHTGTGNKSLAATIFTPCMDSFGITSLIERFPKDVRTISFNREIPDS